MPASISAEASMISRAPVARAIAEQAFQLTQRLAALPVGVGVDEIVETFGLGEIELAVLERAAGEFAGLRRPDLVESWRARQTARPARRARHGREIPRRPRRSRWRDAETKAPPHRRSAAGWRRGAEREWRRAARASCRPARSGRDRPAVRTRERWRSRLAAGLRKAQRWFGRADASAYLFPSPRKGNAIPIGGDARDSHHAAPQYGTICCSKIAALGTKSQLQNEAPTSPQV